MVEIVSLREVQHSQSAIVHEVTGDPQSVERVIRRGIAAAVPVTVVGPGAEPDSVVVRLPESTFMLTREEAEAVKVSVGMPDELAD